MLSPRKWRPSRKWPPIPSNTKSKRENDARAPAVSKACGDKWGRHHITSINDQLESAVSAIHAIRCRWS